MKITKFTLKVNEIQSNYESFENDLKSILGDDLNSYMADSECDDNYVIYFYSDNDDILSKIIDIFIDYRALINMTDITDDVKTNYSQFKDIDSITRGKNYDLLRKYFKSIYSDDFALDYISSNGMDKFNECIVDKFFPKFYN